MSKYIKLFDTEEAYEAQKATLPLPNVSLIDSTGEVKFNDLKYNAEAGDIVLYDNDNKKFVIVKPNDYSTSTYPSPRYGTVGVAVYEAIDGLRVIAANTPSGTLSEGYLKWQNTAFDWGLPKLTTDALALADFDGKHNTEVILNAIDAYDKQNSTDNVTDNIPQYIKEYETDGTIPSDWYIPAAGELYKVYENATTINDSLSKVGNRINTSTYYTSSSEQSSSQVKQYNFNFNYWQNSSKTGKQYFRPLLLLQ